MKQLIDGIELIGKTKDDGYKNPFYLIRTPNKQYIQLSELLYYTVFAMKIEKSTEKVAAIVSEMQDKEVDAEAVHFLIAAKLEPLGIITDSSIIFQTKKTPLPKTPDLLHLLKYRFTLLPAQIVKRIAQFFTLLFNPWVILAVFIGVFFLNWWLFGMHGLSAGLKQTMYEPILFILVFGLILLSSLFHELGHAAGSLYGGGQPGRIGAGVYIIWPAFFTDITDVYRLGRHARLRSDFGGVYFNLVFSLFIAIVYLFTRFEPLLLLILFQNLTIMHQLMPFMRLDGYFIVSDLVGISDLFIRIKPILQNVFLRKQSHVTKDLKLWVKLVVSLWIIIMVPLLVIILGAMLLNAPAIFHTAWASATIQYNALQDSLSQKDYFVSIVRTLQLVIMILPALGICAIFYLLGKPLVLKINSKLDSYVYPQTYSS